MPKSARNLHDIMAKVVIVSTKNETATKNFGSHLGAVLKGGEVIELIGDIGAGKTTLVKGIARGLGVKDNVQSPSFTVSRVYEARDGLRLVHYDFYRLKKPGIIAHELAEVIRDTKSIVVVEWASPVRQVLPSRKISVKITATSKTNRELKITGITL